MNCVDVFSGCGGLTLGLHRAGIKGIFAIEKSLDAFSTLKANLIQGLCHFAWPKWLPQSEHDINEVLKVNRKQLAELRGKVDLLAGGPPCQGFSLAGRRRNGDKRNRLVHSYIAMVDAIQPKCLLLENVRGFTIPFKVGGKKKQYSSLVVEELKSRGYDVAFELIDFSRFGVPQHRTRFILVGISREMAAKGVRANSFFKHLNERREKFLSTKGLPKTPISAKEALSDLQMSHGKCDSKEFRRFQFGLYGEAETAYQRLMRTGLDKNSNPDSHRFACHSDEVRQRFQTAIDKKLTSSSYRRMFALRKSSTKLLNALTPTPTLTTLPDDYIHYAEPRILTVREYARLQSFPDTYVFKGKYTTGGKRRVLEVPRYSQIGNAIPPLFGEIAGLVLKELCDGK